MTDWAQHARSPPWAAESAVFGTRKCRDRIVPRWPAPPWDTVENDNTPAAQLPCSSTLAYHIVPKATLRQRHGFLT